MNNEHTAPGINCLNNKLEKLSNSTKSSGDPDCPTGVLRAKIIAKNIRDSAVACTLGALDYEDHLQSNQSEDSHQSLSGVATGASVANKAAGNRRNKCKFSASGRINDELSTITKPVKGISNKFHALLDIVMDDRDGYADILRVEVE